MSAHLLGIGTARPPRSIAQTDAAQMAVGRCAQTRQQARVLPALYRRTTVQRRASTILRGGRAQAIDAGSWDWFYPSIFGEANGCDPSGGAASHENPGGDITRAGSDGNAVDPSPHGPSTAARIGEYRRHAPPLALEACRNALAEAEIDPAAATHLLVVTCTGFAAPGVDFELIRRLGLPRNVARTQIGFMGCHAAINGLRVAAALAAAPSSGPPACVLMCCVELCSLHFQYGWDSERITANALFADGAAAAVIADRPRKEEQAKARPAESPPPPRITDTASMLIDDTEDEMSWHVGDHGFVMTLSSRVPQLIGRHVRPWLDDWLNRRGLRVEDVGCWAIHPGGPRILHAVVDRLGLDEPASRASGEILRTCGNMSSATVLFILQRLREARAPLPCVLIAFGPGLVAEAALLDF